MKSLPRIFSAAVMLAALGSAAQAQTVLLDFGSGTVANDANSPGHQRDPTRVSGLKWNQVSTTDVTSIADQFDLPTGVAVDLGQETSGTSSIMSWTTTTVSAQAGGAGVNSGVYAGQAGHSFTFANTSNAELGARISGLSAGKYVVYVSGRNTNTTVLTVPQAISFTTRPNSTANFDYSALTSKTISNNDITSSTWQDGVHYVVSDEMTLAAGDDIILISKGTQTESRGFLNSVEIVAVPEPTFVGLLGIAGIGMLARRRSSQRK